MPAPTLTFTLTRPTRTDGSPFTPSVFNADRCPGFNVTVEGVFPAEGGIIGGNQSVSGTVTVGLAVSCVTLTMAATVALTQTTVTAVTATGSYTTPDQKIGASGTAMKLVYAAVYTKSFTKNSYANGQAPTVPPLRDNGRFFITTPAFIPNGLTLPQLYIESAKYSVFAFKSVADFDQQLVDAHIWGNGQLYIETELYDYVTYAQLMANDPIAFMNMTVTVLIFKHTA